MDRTFDDAEERTWTLRVHVGSVEKVRQIEVDLVDLTSATMKRLSLDDVLLVRVLWLLLEDQADAKEVTADAFGESMFGQPLEDGFDALKGAVEDFFPPRKRKFWLRMIQADEADVKRALELALEALDDPQTRVEMDQAMRAGLKREIGKGMTRLKDAGDSPDSSESTPPPEPCES